MDLRQPISPQNNPSHNPGSEAAANMIRQKIDNLYNNEPSARTEMRESVAAGPLRSKHQQYMYDLSISGRPLAEIQAAWHAYYAALPDNEKHAVWQEFYAAHQTGAKPQPATASVTYNDTARKHTGPELHLPTPGNVQQLQSVQPQAVRAHLDFEDLPSALPHHVTGTARRLPTHSDQPTPSHRKKAVSHSTHRVTRATHVAKTQLDSAKQHLERLKAPRNERMEQSVAEVHEQIIAKATSRAKLTPKHHLKALGFGLSMGVLVVVLLLFSFFNERFVAPFITPSRTVSATPIIIDPTKPTIIGTEPKVIIPKINVEVPVVYGLGTIEEKAIQNALEGGVVHYDTTSMPGEKGNVIIFGHSSNNILNKGKYKFAFVLLSRLEAGDLFMLQKDSKQYVYKVFNKRIVKPEEVDILSKSPRAAMATLITCDPPGTSLNRLLVEAEQISPDPAGNTESTAITAPKGEQPTVVPGNAPSLFDRIRNWF